MVRAYLWLLTLMHRVAHFWAFSHEAGAHRYYECLVCKARDSSPIPGSAGPVDDIWLSGDDHSIEPRKNVPGFKNPEKRPPNLQDAEYTLICPFLTDDPAYAHGVEFGLIYSHMLENRAFAGPILRGNQDQVLLLANRLKWTVVKMEPIDCDWLQIEMAAPE